MLKKRHVEMRKIATVFSGGVIVTVRFLGVRLHCRALMSNVVEGITKTGISRIALSLSKDSIAISLHHAGKGSIMSSLWPRTHGPPMSAIIIGALEGSSCSGGGISGGDGVGHEAAPKIARWVEQHR